MRKCRKCGAPEGMGRKCPECGADYALGGGGNQLGGGGNQAGGSGEDWAAQMTRNHPLLSLLLIVLVGAFAWVSVSSMFSGSGNDSSDSADRPQLERAAERKAWAACRDHLYSIATRPGALSVGAFRSQTRTMPAGNIVVHIPFSEENLFGVKVTQQINCSISPEGRVVSANVNYR